MAGRRTTTRRQPSREMAEGRAILERVGGSPVDRLRWAVRRVQEGRRGLTPGQREDLRGELAVFAGLGPRGGGAEWADGELVKPAAGEAAGMLEILGQMVQAAVNRQAVVVPRAVGEVAGPLNALSQMIEAAVSAPPPPGKVPSLLKGLRQMVEGAMGTATAYDQITWDQRHRRFVLWDDDDSDRGWLSRAQKVLARLLLENGHLVRACPAPAPRENDGQCAEWFVATRPRQAYCSTRCQSRAATRRFRGRPHGRVRRLGVAGRSRKRGRRG